MRPDLVTSVMNEAMWASGRAAEARAERLRSHAGFEARRRAIAREYHSIRRLGPVRAPTNPQELFLLNVVASYRLQRQRRANAIALARKMTAQPSNMWDRVMSDA